MIIALQGTPGSGKTTACRNLNLKHPQTTYWIREIVVELTNSSGPYDYLQNDLEKWHAARATRLNGHCLIDRDFTSTLAFYATLHGFESEIYQQLKQTVDLRLKDNTLNIADHLCRFTLSADQSLARQAATNQSIWQDVDFLIRFEDALDMIIANYYKPGNITTIPSQKSAKDVINIIENLLATNNKKVSPMRTDDGSKG